MNELCEDCWKWKEFGKKCRFFWPDKHKCSQFTISENATEQLVSVDSFDEWLGEVKRIVNRLVESSKRNH